MTKEELIELTKNVYRLTLLFPKKEPLRYKIREAADDVVICFITKKRNDHFYGLKENIEVITSFLEIAKSQNWVSPQLSLEIKKEYDRINQELNLEKEEVLRQEECQKKEEVYKETKIEEEKNEKKEDAQEGLRQDENSNKTSSIQVSSPVFLISESKKEEEPVERKEEEDNDSDSTESSQLTSAQLHRQNSIIDYLKRKGQAQVWEIQNIFPKISKRTIRRDFRLLLKHGLIERVGERNKTYYKLKVNVS